MIDLMPEFEPADGNGSDKSDKKPVNCNLLIRDIDEIPPNQIWHILFFHAVCHEVSSVQNFLFEHIRLDLIMELELDCFECLVCGYIYNPEAGDPAGGVPPGVTFFSIPDDWLCPECSAGKNEFALVEL
jgi:rubredoxin